MIIIDIIHAVILLGVCVYSIISDIKTGKILNSVLLSCGFISFLFLIVKFLFFSQDDIVLFVKNSSLIIAISVIGYAMKIWAGGDCKLAIFFSVSYPTLFYFDYNSERMTLWLFIVFAFVLGFFYIIFDSFFHAFKDDQRFCVKTFLQGLKYALFAYLRAFVYITALNQIYTLFVHPYVQLNSLIYAAISMVFVYVISIIKPLKNHWVVLTIGTVDILVMVISNNYSVFECWETYILVLSFIIIRLLVSKYNYAKINTSEITEGMVLSRADSLLLQHYRIKGMPGISDETLRSRITSDEANLIRRWGKTKHGKNELLIVRKIPFALFLSVAIILYLLIGVFQICGLI